jgi:hypothetical protein
MEEFVVIFTYGYDVRCSTYVVHVDALLNRTKKYGTVE